jgi:hypothetical protein
MQAKIVIARILGVGLLIAVLAGAWYITFGRPPKYCQLSDRLIQPHMLTVVRIDGKKLYACCARCALTEERQTGKSVEIVSVTDYLSGRQIDARKAWFVDGSRVAPCCSPAMKAEEGRTPYMRMFDRCSPSLIAFRQRNQALSFIAKNGGKLTTLNDLDNQNKTARHGVSQ